MRSAPLLIRDSHPGDVAACTAIYGHWVQHGLASFEPAFVDELAVALRFAFAHLQRHDTPPPGSLLRDEAGGAAYLRLSTRPLEQPRRRMTTELEQDILQGAYWMRPPGPNPEVVVAYAGAIAPEAIQAVGLLAEDRAVHLFGREPPEVIRYLLVRYLLGLFHRFSL